MTTMNTDWFHDAKWGVFVHYGPAGGREWTARVEVRNGTI